MTIPYLPFEIWENIHSYLAPNGVINLIGVNRYFFEAAMDEIYNQVYISDADDEGQNKRLQQLQNLSIAARVRHVKMTPYFLPQSDNDGKPLPQSTSSVFLKKTIKVLYNCKNIETLTIYLPYCRAVTTPFHHFISNLISKAGSQLRTLSVKMTVMHFRVLDAFLAAKWWSPRVKAIDLTIFPSYGTNGSKQVMHYKPPVDVVEGFQRHLLGLLSLSRPFLESLHIINYDFIDLSALFTNLVGFSSLKEFTYQGHCRGHYCSHLQTLDGLLTSSPSLEHFSFTALSHSLFYTSPPVGYYEDERWLALFNKNSFKIQLTTPNDLSIHLPEDLSTFDLDALPSNLSIFAPKVKRIAIISLQGLAYIHFRQLLDGIARVFKKQQDRGDYIGAIEFDRLDIFSPVHLNEMLRQMRGLTTLTIGFESLNIDPMIRRRRPDQSRTEFEDEVFAGFRAFEYATSKLKCLSLARWSKLGGVGVRDVQPRLLENLGIALPSVQVIQAFSV